MSKLAPILATGTGAAVVSVGGMYILNAWGDSEDGISPELPFTDLTSFQKKKEGDCAKLYFGDLDYEKDKGDQITTNIDNNKYW